MSYNYVCNSCGRKISQEDYKRKEDILCDNCGGIIEEKLVKNTNRTENSSSKLPNLIKCNSCGNSFSIRAAQCPNCGSKRKKSCQICHQIIPIDSNTCPKCGDPTPFEINHSDRLVTIEKASNHYPYNNNEKNNHEGIDTESFGWLLFSFKGRINRYQYWMGTLCAALFYFLIVFLCILALFGYHIAFDIIIPKEEAKEIAQLIGVLSSLWVTAAVCVKRCHDRNKSDLWCFLLLVPLIGLLWATIELGFMNGQEGSNSYGDPPPLISGLAVKTIFLSLVLVAAILGFTQL